VRLRVNPSNSLARIEIKYIICIQYLVKYKYIVQNTKIYCTNILYLQYLIKNVIKILHILDLLYA